MFRRFVWAGLATLGVFATVATPAQAQVVETREKGGADKLTVGADICLSWVFRDEIFDAVFPRRGPGPIEPHNETFADLVTTIFMRGTLKNKFSASLVLETAADPYGGEASRLGDNAADLLVEAAYLEATDFGWDSFPVSAKLGLFNVREELRPRRGHGAFFLDVHHSEDPFTGAVHTASTMGAVSTGVSPAQSGVPSTFGGGVAAVYPGDFTDISPPSPFLMTPDPTMSQAGWNPFLGGNAWISNLVGQRKRSEFGGADASVDLYERLLSLRVFAGTTLESGSARSDTQVFGIRLQSDFTTPTGAQEQGSTVRLSYTAITSHRPIAVHSWGAAMSLKLAKDYVEAYGEFIGQNGVYTDFGRPGFRSHTPHKAYAWYSGGRIEIPLSDLGLKQADTSGQHVFLDSSWWQISGDDGNPLQANEDFLSFESVEDGLLLEGATYGFDIDSNYQALKVEMGIQTTFFTASVFWGNYRLMHGPSGGGALTSIGNRLGNEIDLRLRVHPMDNLEIGLAAAFLFQSDFFPGLVRDRFLIEQAIGTGQAPAERGHLQRAQLIVLSLKVQF